MRRAARFLVLIFAVAWSLGCGRRDGHLNVVLILVDDLGWRDLGVYGSSFHETPHIDRLAEDGVRFSNAYATSPVCSPSRASIMTGKYPARLGFTNVLLPKGWVQPGRLRPPPAIHSLPPEEVTVAEAFRDAGYATFLVGKWHLSFDTARDPPRHGFERYRFDPWRRNRPSPAGALVTDRYTDRAIELIESRGERPFLLFLWYEALHAPPAAKPEQLRKYQAKAAKLAPSGTPFHRVRGGPPTRRAQNHPTYAGMLENLDANIGRLLGKLEALGLADDTVVVLTSDNGGSSMHPAPLTSNLPLRNGKGWLYEGGSACRW